MGRSDVRAATVFDVLEHLGVTLKSQASHWLAYQALVAFIGEHLPGDVARALGGGYGLFQELAYFYYGLGLERQPDAYRALRGKAVGAAGVERVAQVARRLEEEGASGACMAPGIAAAEAMELLGRWTGPPPAWAEGLRVLAIDAVQDQFPNQLGVLLHLAHLGGARRLLVTAQPDSAVMVAAGNNYLGMLEGDSRRASTFGLKGHRRSPAPIAELLDRVEVRPAPASSMEGGCVAGRIFYVRVSDEAELRSLVEASGGPLVAAHPMLFSVFPPRPFRSTDEMAHVEVPVLTLWNAGGALRLWRDLRSLRSPVEQWMWEAIRGGISRTTETLLLVDLPPDPLAEATVVQTCQGIAEFAVLTLREWELVNRSLAEVGPHATAEALVGLAGRMLEIAIRGRPLPILDGAGLEGGPERAARMARAAIAVMGRDTERSDPVLWKHAWTLHATGLSGGLGDGSDRDARLLAAADAMGRAGLPHEKHLLEIVAAVYRMPPEAAAGHIGLLIQLPTLPASKRVAEEAVRWWLDQAAALDFARLPGQALPGVWSALQRSAAFCGQEGGMVEAVRRQYGARLERDRRWEGALDLWRGGGPQTMPDAARCLEALKRWREAAVAWEGAGRPEDALRCWREVPSPEDALRVARALSDPSAASVQWLAELQAASGPITAAELKLAEGLLRRVPGAGPSRPGR